MNMTFDALTAENTEAVDNSVTPDATPSALDLNAIVARLDNLAERLEKIESAEKQEPWHYNKDNAAAGYRDGEIDGEQPPEEKESEDKE